jgi:hypothetical protein
MKEIRLSLLVFILLAACAPSRFAQTTQRVIDHSSELLLQKRLEKDSNYDGASFVQVNFFDKSMGAFVALGFVEPPHGYQFLYRMHGDQFDLMSLRQTPGVVWGVHSLLGNNQPFETIDIEAIHIFTSKGDHPRQAIKVTGSSSAYDLWKDGYFEIIEITDTGPHILFTGAEYWTDQTMFDVQFQYKYLDSDSDGNIDFILETSDRCEYQVDNFTGARQDFGCLKAQVIHRFDGTSFVEQIPP